MSRELLQKCLARMYGSGGPYWADDLCAEIRAALAAPEPEPVAYGMRREDGLVLDVICPDERDSYQGEYTVPLYTAPVVHPSLTNSVDGQNAPDLTDKIDPLSQSRVVSEPAAPVVREPLSDEQIWTSWQIMAANANAGLLMPILVEVVRAVESAHGIAAPGSDNDCTPNHFCNRVFVHLPAGEMCERCGHE